MAYNSGYNPDALPAHAEPEQAAQLLASQSPQPTQPLPPQQQPQQQYQQPEHGRKYSNPPQARPYAHSNPQSYNHTPPQYQYQNKPAPPLPGRQPSPQQPQLQPPPNNRPPPSNWNNSYTQPTPPQQQHYNQAPHQPPPANSPPQNHTLYNTPPPPNYGHGPPPQSHDRPPPPSRPPGTPAPPSSNPSGDASLFPLFKAVDKTGTGQLTERELGKALVNGDFTQFDGHTVRMMIRMFDGDRDGSVNFEEFCGLWSFLASWRALFDRFDEDSSGSISLDEYTNALVAFGYRLSSHFVQMLYATYDKAGRGKMSFDLFVQSCIVLKRMTDVFKRYDEDRDGYITLSFEEFLTEILRQR